MQKRKRIKDRPAGIEGRRKRDPRSALFYTAVTILTLLLITLTAAFVTGINREYYRYTVKPDDLLYTLNRGDYVEAWSDVQNNRASGKNEEADPEYVLPYAVVDYYEAGSYYTVYQENGDVRKAEDFRRIMEQAYEKMGELQFLAGEIDSVLEIS